ncbi:hypothetical protein [uncultured Jannaschia sp.]|uniref:hypothetical protein n=1 Tax=uncultured Jannaschia sp. TaxID=293347 RepID=UPI0026280501|nr:hypothetical protein [uncultured Jannaschia sp.]
MPVSRFIALDGHEFVPPLIALLRQAACECRAAPRADLYACAVLAPEAGAEDFAVALVRALVSATDRRVVLRRPGAEGLSFDESWLMALSAALTRGDADSVRFLAGRRVRPEAGPVLRLLLSGLARNLEPF